MILLPTRQLCSCCHPVVRLGVQPSNGVYHPHHAATPAVVRLGVPPSQFTGDDGVHHLLPPATLLAMCCVMLAVLWYFLLLDLLIWVSTFFNFLKYVSEKGGVMGAAETPQSKNQLPSYFPPVL